MIETDFCIVGGGVMGSATAFWLSKEKSLKTVLIDQYKIANEHCSSSDANRVFRYAYGPDEMYTRMAVESGKLWRYLEEEVGERLLLPTGLLMLQGEDDESNKFNEESYETLTHMELGAEKVEKHRLAERFPQFKAESAIFDPHGGVLLASKALTALSEKAKANGVKIIENTKATMIGRNPRTLVQTATGQTIVPRRVIVTVGPWSNLFRGEEMPSVTPTRQQVVYLRPKTGLDHFRPGRFPVFFADRYYGLPAAGVEGVKVSHKGVWDPIDPDAAKRPPDMNKVEDCRVVCGKFIPTLVDSEVVQAKVCLYDMTENSDFVVGSDPKHADTVFGYGFSGHGFKFAPLIGRLLSELASDRKPSFAIDRFTPLRSIRGPTILPA